MTSEPDRGRSHRPYGLFALVIFSAVVGALLVFFSVWSPPEERPRKAAIIDHLGLTYPNPRFTAEAGHLFREIGYEVDYFAGAETTVNFYRTFPAEDYDYVIFRVHAATLEADRQVDGAIAGDLGLFTSEPYSTARYVREQSLFRLYKSGYVGGDEWYFGVGSQFISSSMRSRFRGTVILMGCEGAKYEAASAALIDKGADAVIGWSADVTPAHTDAATLQLLRRLLIENLKPEVAVQKTMNLVGADPVFGAELVLYTD